MHEPAPPTLAIDLWQVATYLLVVFGPMNVVPPFLALTARADEAACRRLARRGTVAAAVAAAVAGAFGLRALHAWRISLPALLIAAAIVLFLVALHGVLHQYAAAATPPPQTADPAGAADAAPPPTAASIAPLAFPTILPPYGIAVLILLLAAAPGWGHAAAIFAVFIGVLLVDLLVMTFARQIVGAVGEASLRIVGTILGVLQLALAVQMVQAALVLLGVLPPFAATLPG